MSKVKIRPAEDTDLDFVIASWLNHYKSGSYFAKRIRNSTYYENHEKIVKHILAKPTTTVLVAHDPLDHDSLFGFLVYESMPGDDVLHYCFVKAAFQNLGVARALIEHSKIGLDKASFTHWTFAMNTLTHKFPSLNYNPYRI